MAADLRSAYQKNDTNIPLSDLSKTDDSFHNECLKLAYRADDLALGKKHGLFTFWGDIVLQIKKRTVYKDIIGKK